MSIKSSMSEIEDIVCGSIDGKRPGLTDDQKQAIRTAFVRVVEAVKGLDVIPERLFKLTGLLMLEMAVKYSAGWKAQSLVNSAIEASPRLLKPHRADVEGAAIGMLERKKG